MNIRTIFDLERCVLNAALRHRLLVILSPAEYEKASSARLRPIPDQTSVKGSEVALDPEDELDAIVLFIRDDLHVRRLRQIWDVINGGLDERFVRSASIVGPLDPPAAAEPASPNAPHGGLSPAGSDEPEESRRYGVETREVRSRTAELEPTA